MTHENRRVRIGLPFWDQVFDLIAHEKVAGQSEEAGKLSVTCHTMEKRYGSTLGETASEMSASIQRLERHWFTKDHSRGWHARLLHLSLDQGGQVGIRSEDSGLIVGIGQVIERSLEIVSIP